jgi:predicted small lipoprotein YifL
MRYDIPPVSWRSRAAGCRRCGEPYTRVFGIVTISIMLLCGGLGCGRKGPLKPLKKTAPAYNVMQTGLALPDLCMVPVQPHPLAM